MRTQHKDDPQPEKSAVPTSQTQTSETGAVASSQSAPPQENTATDSTIEAVNEEEELETEDPTIRAEYARFTSHLWQQKNNSESQADNLILTLSSAFFGVSVAFLKDVVPPDKMLDFPLLVCSWVCLILSILFTLFSFFLSRITIDMTLTAAPDLFFKQDDTAYNRTTNFSAFTTVINTISAFCFVAGLVLTSMFVTVNLNRARSRPSDKPPIAQLYLAPNQTTLGPIMGTTPPRPPALPKPRPKPKSAIQAAHTHKHK